VADSSSTAAARLTVTVAPEWDLAALMPDGAVGASAAGRAAVATASTGTRSWTATWSRWPPAGRGRRSSWEGVGVDLSDPGFWATGLALLERNLGEAARIERNLGEAQSTSAAMAS
jgi:hypothetical protein